MATATVARRARRPGAAAGKISHRLAFAACWAAGLALCAIAVAIVGYMAYRGAQYLRPRLLTERPQPGLDQQQHRRLPRPAARHGAADASSGSPWPRRSPSAPRCGSSSTAARAGWPASIESAIEVVAGTPDIVIAIFGLAIFQLPLLAPLCFTASGGGVFGRSFFAAGAMMSLIALPLVYRLHARGPAWPSRRGCARRRWALGKTKICTIREVLLPPVRRNIATGATLGMGRIVGDTAVVVVLLGASLQIDPEGERARA